ncbi:MAG: extracellular solute-binding protein [Actinomycetota bacterium]
MPTIRRTLAAATGVACTAVAVTGGVAAATAGAASSHEATDLVVYTGRKEALIAPALRAFEAETGIKVKVKSGSNGALAQAILAERGQPQASVFISQDAPTCELLRREGALAPSSIPALNVIPGRFRAVDGSWVGISGRVRVLMYNKNLVRKDQLPQSVLDLTRPEWRGKVAMASSKEASVASWAGALVLQLGKERATAYLTKLKANGLTVLPGHTDVRKAVGRGEFAIGLVNHYYYHLESADGSPVGVVYPDQQRLQRVKVKVRGSDGAVRTVIRGKLVPKSPLGVLFNAATLCLVKDGPAPASARAFVEYMTSARAQVNFSELNYEYPLRTGLPATNGVRPIHRVTQAPVNLRDIDAAAGLDALKAAGIE